MSSKAPLIRIAAQRERPKGTQKIPIQKIRQRTDPRKWEDGIVVSSAREVGNHCFSPHNWRIAFANGKWTLASECSIVLGTAWKVSPICTLVIRRRLHGD